MAHLSHYSHYTTNIHQKSMHNIHKNLMYILVGLSIDIHQNLMYNDNQKEGNKPPQKRKGETKKMSVNELDTMVDQIRELKRIIEEAEAEITGLEDAIKAQMTERNVDTMRGINCKVTWKQTTTTRIDSKTLKKELPDVAARYSLTTTYRRFLIA